MHFELFQRENDGTDTLTPPGDLSPGETSDEDAATHTHGNVKDNEVETDEVIDPTELTGIYNQFEIEDLDDGYEFLKVMNHTWKDGVLYFHVRYSDQNHKKQVLEQPFDVIKKDIPLEMAKYIRNYVTDSSEQGIIPHGRQR